MAFYEESNGSLPYIDDNLTDDDIKVDECQYNLRIIENYQNKGRNIEISNTRVDDITATSLSPVAPLAEETEVSDSQEDETIGYKKNGVLPQPTVLKLIIKGYNSTITIQGLDNKSSITFRKKSEKIRREKSVEQRKEILKKNSLTSVDTMKTSDKPKKGRWRILTRSLISKSSKFERRISDERYPKYVLLKNEEEEEEEKKKLLKREPDENYPKMVIFNSKISRKLESSINENQKERTNKPEFSFKKTFKNKTEPAIEKLLEKGSKSFDKRMMKPLKKSEQEKKSREKRDYILRKNITEETKEWEGEESKPQENEQEVIFDFTNHPVFQGNLFNEIQGILEEALNLYADVKTPNQAKETVQPATFQQPPPPPPPPLPPEQPQECHSSVPPQICQFTCHDPHCYQSPMYIPVYNQYEKPRHSYRNFQTQTNENDFEIRNQQNPSLQFGILSSFFPGAVVMKTYQCDNLDPKIEDVDFPEEKLVEINKIFTTNEEGSNTLKVPLPDITIKSKMVLEEKEQIQKPEEPESCSADGQLEDSLTHHQNSNSDEEDKTKADDSEATEYLYYNESESQENESTTTTLTINKKVKEDEEKNKQGVNSQNLLLTKVGYKMYDSLTKLSLDCEKDSLKKAEEKECDCTIKTPKKCSLNISVESRSGTVKFTIPEEEMMLALNGSRKGEIQIGISKLCANDAEDKKLVWQNELWHPDNGKISFRTSAVKKETFHDDRKDSHKIKLSMDNNKEVVLSIEMDEGKMEKEKPMKRDTKEMKVGTDDIDLAGGNLLCTKGSSYKNLSPRTGQLLRNLEEKLEFSERRRKILVDEIKRKIEDEILERSKFPGLYFVQQISPHPSCKSRKSLQVPCLKQPKKVSDLEDLSRLREYYCEECLATMRIFEDEYPSVKRMVDKFETIIQLDKY